jgi:hypothetical protein
MQMVDEERFKVELGRIRKRRRQVWYVVVGIIPASAIAILVGDRAAFEFFSKLLALVWVIVIYPSGSARCQRCGNVFGARSSAIVEGGGMLLNDAMGDITGTDAPETNQF